MWEDSRLQQCDARLLSRIAKTPSRGPEDHTTANASSAMHRDRAGGRKRQNGGSLAASHAVAKERS